MPQVRSLHDVVRFNEGIRECEKAARLEFTLIGVTLSLLWDMPRLRLLPNVMSFNGGISACEKAAQWDLL